MLAKYRVTTAAAILSLALGIGANTAIFSLMNALILRSLPVSDPGRLIRLNLRAPQGSNGNTLLSIPILQGIEKNQSVFSDLFAWDGGGVQNLEANGTRYSGSISIVTGGYFSTLGILPQLGRTITPEDLSLNAGQPAAVAVISYNCWKGRYNGSSAVIGQVIRVENRPLTIIGVTPESFSGLIIDTDSDVTVPLGFSGGAAYRDKKSLGFQVFARLKSGIMIDQANAQMDSIWPALRSTVMPEGYTGAKREAFLARGLVVESAANGNSFLRKRYRQPLIVLMVMVGLLLLIACVNLANLTLARTAGRKQELSLRVALGAGKWRIMRQILIESLILSLTGSVLGLLIAQWASGLLLRTMWSGYIPLALNASPDIRVLAFTALLSLLTGVLFGLSPAWNIFRTDPIGTLKQTSRTVRGASGLLGKVLICAQVAVSLVLVIGAGLFVRSLAKLRSVEPGYSRDGVLVVQAFPKSDAESRRMPNRASYYEELAKSLAQIPGVASVSYSHMGPATGYEYKEPASVAFSQSPPVQAMFEAIGPDFFRVVKMRLLAGREFNWRDKDGALPVAIISENLSHRLFDGENPIARTIDFGTRTHLEVIGVVSNASLWMVQSREPMAVYLPLMQLATYDSPLIDIRTGGNPLAILPSVRRSLDTAGRHIILKSETLEHRAEYFLLTDRIIAALSACFAGLAMLLASIGLFGLMSYTVTNRTSEIGLRMALGAQQTNVQALIMKDAMSFVLAGVAIGIFIALAASNLVQKMIYGIDARDALTMVLASSILLISALIAAYIPARRASLIDPMQSLRSD